MLVRQSRLGEGVLVALLPPRRRRCPDPRPTRPPRRRRAAPERRRRRRRRVHVLPVLAHRQRHHAGLPGTTAPSPASTTTTTLARCAVPVGLRDRRHRVLPAAVEVRGGSGRQGHGASSPCGLPQDTLQVRRRSGSVLLAQGKGRHGQGLVHTADRLRRTVRLQLRPRLRVHHTSPRLRGLPERLVPAALVRADHEGPCRNLLLPACELRSGLLVLRRRRRRRRRSSTRPSSGVAPRLVLRVLGGVHGGLAVGGEHRGVGCVVGDLRAVGHVHHAAAAEGVRDGGVDDVLGKVLQLVVEEACALGLLFDGAAVVRVDVVLQDGEPAALCGLCGGGGRDG